MKIFLFTPYYPPQPQAAAVRCFWLGRILRDAGNLVTIWSSISTPESKRLLCVPASNTSSFLWRLIKEALSGCELFVRILFARADLFLLSSSPFITVYIGQLACRLKRAKYVLDIRDIYPEVYFAQGLIRENSLIGRALKSLTRRMYINAHGISSVTPGLLSRIRELAPESKKMALVTNGFDRELFRPSTEKYPQFTVVFHGTMGHVQNLRTILEVAKKLESREDMRFIFIGDGPQAGLLKESTLRNISYLGPREYSEIPGLIARAHVGFSARRDDQIGADAYPVKVFEYLGVGIPCIVTPRSGLASRISSEGIFEFDNSETDEICQKLLELKENPPNVTVPENLSRQETAKKILDLCAV